MVGEDAPSRSAVGRYVKNANDQMRRYQEAQEVAKVWIAKMGNEPEGDVGRLLAEMLRTVAFQVIGSMDTDGDEVDAKSIMMLARGIKDLAAADKASGGINDQGEGSGQEGISAKLEKLEESAPANGRLDIETLRKVREEIYGIV